MMATIGTMEMVDSDTSPQREHGRLSEIGTQRKSGHRPYGSKVRSLKLLSPFGLLSSIDYRSDLGFFIGE